MFQDKKKTPVNVETEDFDDEKTALSLSQVYKDINTDDLPPSYDAATGAAPTIHGFPPSFYLFFKPSWKMNEYAIGLSKTAPLYAVSLHTGLTKNPRLVLHTGPDKNSPWLATANETKWTGKQTACTLHASPHTSDREIAERLTRLHQWSTSTWAFSIEVAQPDGTTAPERFEWRSSRGPEVKQAERRSIGFKLVRLDGGAGAGGRRAERGVGVASDGCEVVAVWACHSKMSLSKWGRFMFLGRGASGEMGSVWTLMAVLTALKIAQVVCEETTAAVTAVS